MLDFLSFHTFVARDILILFYYIGAIIIPLALYLLRGYYLKKFSFLAKVDAGVKELYGSLSLKNRLTVIGMIVMMFIFMELFWRMMFEMFIAYFNMHDYLFEINNNIKHI
jgi:hypothetical protein